MSDSVFAIAAGCLRATIRNAGFSLGNRACIALGWRLGAHIMTADRAWATPDLRIEVELIR